MRAGLRTVCGTLLLLLGACDQVGSRQPVGEEPLRLEESEWEGTWFHTDGPVTVRVAGAEEGLLEVGWIEERDGRLVLETLDARLLRSEGWIFANFTSVEGEGVEEGEPFLWGRLERSGRELFLWWPRPAEFRRLVEEGVLPGKIEGGDVLLDGLTAEHLAIIVSGEHGQLFEWDEPMAFRRSGEE